MIFSPPMYIGYSRPNSEATFSSASSMALRLSGFEKSTNGSFVNSETWIFASAVAMADSLLDKQTRNCTARVEFATRWAGCDPLAVKETTAVWSNGTDLKSGPAVAKSQTGTACRALRSELARGFGEGFCVEVDVSFGGGGGH